VGVERGAIPERAVRGALRGEDPAVDDDIEGPR
jgi:hypothetical protein